MCRSFDRMLCQLGADTGHIVSKWWKMSNDHPYFHSVISTNRIYRKKKFFNSWHRTGPASCRKCRSWPFTNMQELERNMLQVCSQCPWSTLGQNNYLYSWSCHLNRKMCEWALGVFGIHTHTWVIYGAHGMCFEFLFWGHLTVKCPLILQSVRVSVFSLCPSHIYTDLSFQLRHCVTSSVLAHQVQSDRREIHICPHFPFEPATIKSSLINIHN